LKSQQSTNGLTANYNNYSAAELEKALQSWVEPYPKPIILNHDLNSEPIGRVIAAKMDKETDGANFVRLQIAITDPTAAQKIADKRYLTGSVGGRAGKAVCSISGEDLAQEDDSGKPRFPKYKRGKVYKGKLAFLDMQNISFKEYSFVNQPADQRSGVRSSKKIDGSVVTSDSENWTAKTSAFVLHMDKEDIVSVEENESIFAGLKKKESRPLYLHLKGAFLTAMAIQESETDRQNDNTLLFVKNNVDEKNEENSKMNKEVHEDNVLEVVENLLQSTSKEETPEAEQEKVEQPAEEQTEEAADQEKISSEDSEKTEEQANTAVDSADAEKAEEASSTETEEAKENEEPEAELSDKKEVAEQNADETQEKIQSLEEENKKLKEALHRTLAEKVVDTKIALGIESVEDRDALIEDHMKRTATSLADSLRDMAKLPTGNAVKTKEFVDITVESEVVSNEEQNVLTIDPEVEATEENTETTVESAFEDLLVDALMGRKKL